MEYPVKFCPRLFRSCGATLLLILTVFIPIILADVAPPTGYEGVTSELEIRAKGDLGKFRFFLQTAARDLEEITLPRDAPFVLTGEGRGGASRFVTLWAVQREVLRDGELSTLQLDLLGSEIIKGPVKGWTRLLRHDFRKEVPSAESGRDHRAVYEVTAGEREGNPEARKLGDKEISSGFGVTGLVVGAIVVGILLSGVLLAVVLIMRAAGKRRNS